MKRYKQMEVEDPVFKFCTNDFVNGIIVELTDNNPYQHITVDIWFDSLYSGSFEVPHYVNIDDDYLGSSTAIFRRDLRPFKTTGVIKVKVKTKLLYNDQVNIKLIL